MLASMHLDERCDKGPELLPLADSLQTSIPTPFSGLHIQLSAAAALEYFIVSCQLFQSAGLQVAVI